MDKALIEFVSNVAGWTLFEETEAGQDDNPQKDLDWLISQDETLEGLIHAARQLLEAHKVPKGWEDGQI